MRRASWWNRLKSGSAAGILAMVMVMAIVGSAPAPVQAAELRITLAELARILTATLREPKVRVHNLPGDASKAGSSLTLGSSTNALTVPPRPFERSGVQYAYYINELNSQSVTITAAPSVLRITIAFESADPEIVGRCTGGLCPTSGILPQIEWIAPTVTIDVTPVWENGNLALNAKKVDVGGKFTPRCPGGGFLSGSLCRLLLTEAAKVTAKLKDDVAGELLEEINGDETQARIATGLRPFLRFGPAGEVRFQTVSVDSEMLTLTFCLACEAEPNGTPAITPTPSPSPTPVVAPAPKPAARPDPNPPVPN